MRYLVVTVAVLLVARGTSGAEDARPHDDQDDPKVARFLVTGVPDVGAPEHAAPVFKLGYRGFSARDLDDKSGVPVHSIEIQAFPISTRWLRVGVEAEFALARGNPTVVRDASGNEVTLAPFNGYALLAGAVIGFQYPWRLTPFADFRFAAGLVGGEVVAPGVDGKDTPHALVSYMYVTGLDFGVELYVTGRVFLTACIGWVHTVYQGVDLEQALNPKIDLQPKLFGHDSFTFKLGFGL